LTRQELGALGERHAARLLRAKGYRLLEANYRTPRGEIDIIARDGDILVFVEVRTRTSEAIQTPLASVDADKRAHIERTANTYLRARRLPECGRRYDVVEVLAAPDGTVLEIRHVQGAFVAWQRVTRRR